MNFKTKIITIFTLFALLLSFISCNQQPEEPQEGTRQDDETATLGSDVESSISREEYIFNIMENDVPYQLGYHQFRGTDECQLNYIFFNPDYKGNIIIDIPSQDEDGAILRKIDLFCNYLQVPTVILADDFDKHIREPLNKAVNAGKISSFDCDYIFAGYAKYSLSERESDRAKQQLIQLFPICEYTDIYILSPDYVGMIKRCLDLIDYTDEDCLDDYIRLDLFAKQHNCEIGIKFGVCNPVQAIIIPETVSIIASTSFYGFPKTMKLYYKGEKHWTNALWADEFSNFYYYSETQPSEEGLFWRYIDGVPTPW